MGRRFQVALDCGDPDRLAAFWADVLEYRVVDSPPGHEWSLIVDPDGTGPQMLFHRVPERKVVKNRMHVDIRLAPGTPKETTRSLVDAEARRLVDMGASHVRTDD